MSAYLVPNALVNGLATYARTMRVRGAEAYTDAGLALVLWRANAETIRKIYGPRADRLFPDLGRLDQVFVYAPTPREGLQIVRDLGTYLTNTALDPEWMNSPLGRVCRQIGRWADVECDLARLAAGKAPVGNLTTRWLRRASRRMMNPDPTRPAPIEDEQYDFFDPDAGRRS